MENTEQNNPAMAGISDTHSDAAPSPTKRSSLQASILERTKRKIVAVAPEQCTPSPYSIRHPDELSEAALKPLMDSIQAIGQEIAVRGRMRDGLIETFGSRRHAAVKLLREAGHDIFLLVELVDMDDDAAVRFAHAENEARADLKPLDRARFYERAIRDRYGNGKACADALGVHKSTISRSLDVLRAASVLKDKIDDPRAISAARASWLMSHMRERDADADPTDRGTEGERHAEAIAAIDVATPGSAADVFRQLRDVLEPAHLDGDVEIVVADDQIVGALKRRPNGALRMDLAVEAGQVELPDLIEAIRTAMAKARAI